MDVVVSLPLFPEPRTPRTRPLGSAEPRVRWLTESTVPEAIASRRELNRWYESFPDHAGQFAARLRSDVDSDHQSALDELHVHHLLRQGHADVRYEEGGRGPDFRVYRDGEICVAAVEVRSLFEWKEGMDKRRQHGRLADEINRRLPPSAGYFVNLQVRAASHDPAPRRVAEFIAKEIAHLPPHDQSVPGDPPISARYDRDGVVVDVTFMPMRKGAATKVNPEGRIVGMGPVRWCFPNGDRLRDCVAEKAGGKYDIGDAPFVVAVGVHDWSYAQEQVLDGLYGRSPDQQRPELPLRGNGLFGVDKERPAGRHRRLSGVIVFGDHLQGVAVYANPYAERQVRDLIPGARRFGIVNADGSATLDWL